MSQILAISDAATIALHAAAILAANRDRLVSAHQIVERIGVSGAHLSKVLQRLAKQGIVESVRGPKGGFRLARDPSEVTLLDVYEAVEGKLELTTCLMTEPLCGELGCMFGTVLVDASQMVLNRLSETTLATISATWVMDPVQPQKQRGTPKI